MRWVLWLFWVVLAATHVSAQPADNAQPTALLRIAVASNFAPTLKALTKTYTRETGVPVSISSASTGMLYNQIRYGAPFDLLLAADAVRPARLVEEQLAEPDSRLTYALGRLVLAYSPALQSQAAQGLEHLLTTPELTLAVANPELAPYGVAGVEVLKRFQGVKQRRLLAVNVAQAMQMLVAGGADLALVAKAQQPDHALDIPPDWYSPIVQQAVLLRAASQPALARDFLHWLTGDKARATIEQYGYRLPDRA
ncbi:MAG: molybdate ABC transporter substrate-binding protein [Halieaceae bacterium]|jgi:molybdate transport system substrate-binding protein|nr:molybdate ABC transporter substrate-binding protein [Halieaceae bacterium]